MRPHLGTLSSSTLRHQSDERLVSMTRGGSERAFAEIMRRYQRPLHVYCMNMLGSARAEDAVQQAFMQAFVSLRDGSEREIALRPWLYRIARNCSIDLLRKPGSDHDELDPEYNGASHHMAAAAFEQKEDLAKLVAAIQALPEGQRRALTLRELEGRSYGEISAQLGHTSSGVRQLIFRARTALRNVAAAVFPIGSLRWRLLEQATPASSDPHQLAAAATLSSAGGAGALERVGSIVAATFTLAVAGVAAPPGDHSRHQDTGGTGTAATAPGRVPLQQSAFRPAGTDIEAHQRRRHAADPSLAPRRSVPAADGEGAASLPVAPPLPAAPSQPSADPPPVQQTEAPKAAADTVAAAAAVEGTNAAGATTPAGAAPSGTPSEGANGASPAKGATGPGGTIVAAPSGVVPGRSASAPIKGSKPPKTPRPPKTANR
jgi:RNA polymerase sigma factor (sigma-70 family)